MIGANVGGIPELINDGETGLLFRSGDAVDLREKIVRLYHDRGMLEAMTARTSQTRFADLSEYCDSLIALYQRVI